MNRTEKIRTLIDATLASALSDPDLEWLRAMLGKGFTGYEQMSDAALTRELQLRGLIEFDEPDRNEEVDDDDDEDGDDGDDAEDEVERLIRFAGMVVLETAPVLG